MDDLIKEFLVESFENLDRLDQDFVALEKRIQARGIDLRASSEQYIQLRAHADSWACPNWSP